jgi:Domain of unknown function (DUF4136)
MLQRLKGGIVRAALGIGLVVLMCGFLSAQQIMTNYMPGTDFSKFKTYKWVTIEGSEQPNQILDQQIKQAIETQLASKGLMKSGNEQADLYVAYQVAITQQQEWNAYSTGGPWRGGMATVTTSTIQVGTLDVDFYDPGPKQLVWKGQATKTLNPSKDPKKNQERLNKAVAKLLKDFPPKPGK